MANTRARMRKAVTGLSSVETWNPRYSQKEMHSDGPKRLCDCLIGDSRCGVLVCENVPMVLEWCSMCVWK